MPAPEEDGAADLVFPELKGLLPEYDKHRINMVAVVTAVTGRPPDSVSGGKCYWKCPLPHHKDNTPSFFVKEGKATYDCRGCYEHGDAVDFVQKTVLAGKRRKKDRDYRAAVRWLAEHGLLNTGTTHAVRSGPAYQAGATAPPMTGSDSAPSWETAASPGAKPERPRTLTADLALGVVKFAYRHLRDSSNMHARSVMEYLKRRGLRKDTIDRRQLGFWEGWTEWWPWKSRYGIVIPWVENRRPTLVKYRLMESILFGERGGPRYLELYRSGPTIYPHPGAIRAGCPLIIAEGELEALLLDQECGDFAGVITIGSTSETPTEAIIQAIRAASVVYVALDDDPAGHKAAERWRAMLGWPGQSVRILPPKGKDWTECHQAGVYLRGWWKDILDGTRAVEQPDTAAPATAYDAIDWRDAGLERPF